MRLPIVRRRRCASLCVAIDLHNLSILIDHIVNNTNWGTCRRMCDDGPDLLDKAHAAVRGVVVNSIGVTSILYSILAKFTEYLFVWKCYTYRDDDTVAMADERACPVKIDDPNITIEEYIRLEEEKARRHGKVFNWETATYGKIWDNEDVHDLGSVVTEFPAIVFNDTLTSEDALSCELTVSSLNNNEFDFRISYDESDDEDCTPTVSCFDDLDFFNDLDKEFPAIVYNDAQKSKLDFSTEPVLNP
ncbi:hypothetical protein Tco_0262641 [Tanacetum coccineum]